MGQWHATLLAARQEWPWGRARIIPLGGLMVGASSSSPMVCERGCAAARAVSRKVVVWMWGMPGSPSLIQFSPSSTWETCDRTVLTSTIKNGTRPIACTSRTPDNYHLSLLLVQKSNKLHELNNAEVLNSKYCHTSTFAGYTFLKKSANVKSANVGALFHWEKCGWVPGGLWFIREKSKVLRKTTNTLTINCENAKKKKLRICLRKTVISPSKNCKTRKKQRICEAQDRKCRSRSHFIKREYTGSANSGIRQYYKLKTLWIDEPTYFLITILFVNRLVNKIPQ